MTSSNSPTFKVLVLGDGCVGKTELVNRHLTGKFDARYNATMGVEVHPIKFHTNHGPIIFNLWDCAGQEKFGGLRDGFYIKGQAAIICFDHTSKLTLKNSERWLKDVVRVCSDIPMVLCGTKSDLTIKCAPTDEQEEKYLAYHSLSAKTGNNIEQPFLTLAKRFFGQDTKFIKQ